MYKEYIVHIQGNNYKYPNLLHINNKDVTRHIKPIGHDHVSGFNPLY